MTASNTGGWVRKVGAAGGGKTYRRRRPMNFYGILIVIGVLGVASVALARYDYRHPAAAAPQTPPTTADTWFSALGISTCGDQQPALAANPSAAAGGFTAIKGGAIQVQPTKADQTGANATLQLFVANYPGLALQPSAMVLPPTVKGKKSTSWITGDKCPKGTKDAGKVGHVAITYWRNLSATKATTVTVPGLVHFSPNMLITIGFIPVGGALPKPPASAVQVMLNASPTATTTTTLGIPTTTGATSTTGATTTSIKR